MTSPIETLAARVLAEHLNVVAPLRHIFGAKAQEFTDALEVLVAQEIEHVAAEVARAIADLLTSDRMREVAAQAIYLQSPARTPWGGDDMAFDAPHWAADDKTESARRKATAALAAIRTELEGGR